jgi:hypothetical protein
MRRIRAMMRIARFLFVALATACAGASTEDAGSTESAISAIDAGNPWYSAGGNDWLVTYCNAWSGAADGGVPDSGAGD